LALQKKLRELEEKLAHITTAQTQFSNLMHDIDRRKVEKTEYE
jgi:hypothetical protein